MKTIEVTTPINLKVVKFELDFSSLVCEEPKPRKRQKQIKIPKLQKRRPSEVPLPPTVPINNKKNVKELVEELLDELYADQRDWSTHSSVGPGHWSAASVSSSQSNYDEQTNAIERVYLESLDIDELQEQLCLWKIRLSQTGDRLAKHVRARDSLRRHQKRLCEAFTILIRHITGESGARFNVRPGDEGPGEGGYSEWLHAMRLVARLPAGVPQHFRRKLWLTLADRHLQARGVDWSKAERACFRGTSLPDDNELSAQILKVVKYVANLTVEVPPCYPEDWLVLDPYPEPTPQTPWADLHRTGCSLFCGTEGRENQAMLRRVLLAYARWNKEVGYCQGFNMIAAIILEVMEKSEADSLKVMIYLVEAVLPEGYFADDLRGLSADMAAFRDLLKLRLPRLANHMDHLQKISDGGGVEPPLPDVFTMQWFLTLYATWLPRDALLRIWDLVMLDGNEVLLLTALAIWDMLQERILSTRSADEYYSCMGGGASAVWAASEALVARVVALGSAPELPRLRNLHRYRVAPPAAPVTAPVYQPPLHSAMQSMTKRGLRLFYSEDEGDSSDDGNKMALATIVPPRREDRSGTGDRLSLDIGALKRQYARLRERQRQAHVILAAACARHAAVGVPTSPTSLSVNNLLLGKSAIISSRGRRLGPPPGAIPPSRQTNTRKKAELHKKPEETLNWKEEHNKKSLNRRNSVKWRDIKKEMAEKVRKASIDFDETGDGIIVSELEANEMIASIRRRRSSEESSSYSSHSSSSDTSLCDDNERDSDSEPDMPVDEKDKSKHNEKIDPVTTSSKDTLKPTSLTKDLNMLSPPEPHKTFEESTTDMSNFLESAAGESLRHYIGGFEDKLRESVFDHRTEHSYETSISSKNIMDFSPLTRSNSRTEQCYETSISSKNFMDFSPLTGSDTKNSEETYSITKYEIDQVQLKRITARSYAKSPKKFTDLSPLDLSPGDLNFAPKSPYCYEVMSHFTRLPSPRHKRDKVRTPDIIEEFTKYPHFVPDIDLSDKNISDLESPPRSPGAESIVVSEDEPPIPLKIDEYFENSPEFFGARVTDPNSKEIPNRRAPKRFSRPPKKPDSLTLYSSHNEQFTNENSERASSLPQSKSFTDEKEENFMLTEGKETKKSHSYKFSNIETKTPITIYESLLLQKSQPSVILPSPQKVKDTTPIKIPINQGAFSPKEPTTPLKSEVNYEDIEKLHISSEKPKIEAVLETPNKNIRAQESMSPKDYILQSGHRNSEKALQIIQENSQILSRILTKQSFNESVKKKELSSSIDDHKIDGCCDDNNTTLGKLPESPLLKESTSDSLIGYRKRYKEELADKNVITRVRPISIDDPFSLDNRVSLEGSGITTKSPSSECLGNKTDIYGWENKGFLAKCDYFKSNKLESSNDVEFKHKDSDFLKKGLKPTTPEWSRHSFSGETSKHSVTFPSSEIKPTSPYDKRYTSDEFNYPLSSKYNDFIISKTSDICSKTYDQEPKVCENVLKTDSSQVSDFAHVVTSSISFTYEPSAEDDSPTAAKSNSSDTLCQIASLDQVSTPISPKVFPSTTPTLPKDLEKSERTKVDTDDTCSAITSLIDTDTLSSLSYPRSPSTGSYHPFPTRPAMRFPKELGVKLGMYTKDSLNSPK